MGILQDRRSTVLKDEPVIEKATSRTRSCGEELYKKCFTDANSREDFRNSTMDKETVDVRCESVNKAVAAEEGV